MPLSEVLFDFYDKLKSTSRGYASFDYEVTGYKPVELVKLDFLINGEPLDALSMLVYRQMRTIGPGPSASVFATIFLASSLKWLCRER